MRKRSLSGTSLGRFVGSLRLQDLVGATRLIWLALDVPVTLLLLHMALVVVEGGRVVHFAYFGVF